MITSQQLNPVQTVYTVHNPNNPKLPARITTFTVTAIQGTQLVNVVYTENKDTVLSVSRSTLDPFQGTVQEKRIVDWCLRYHAQQTETPLILVNASSQYKRTWWTCRYCHVSGIAASKNQVKVLAQQHEQECSIHVTYETETI